MTVPCDSHCLTLFGISFPSSVEGICIHTVMSCCFCYPGLKRWKKNEECYEIFTVCKILTKIF